MYAKSQLIVKQIRTKTAGAELTEEQLDDILRAILKNNGAQLDPETREMVEEDGLLILTHLIGLSDEKMAGEIATIIEKTK